MSGDKGFEKLMRDIQNKINIEEEKTYSKKVIKEYRNPSNFGFIKNPDASGKIKGPCNDTMRIDIKIKDNIVSDVRFWTDGCGASIACGSMLSKMVKDKTVEAVFIINSKDLNDALGGLPENHVHCTVLAVNTLKNAIESYHKK